MNFDLDQRFDDLGLDDDGDSVYTEAEENDPEPSIFIEAKKDIKNKEGFWDSNDVDQFFGKYSDIVGPLDKPANNLLHTLVDVVTHNSITPEDIQLLVQRLVKEFPALLEHKNEDKYNPIFMAIKASHYQLVDYMVNACTVIKTGTLHKQSLDVALREKMIEGKTCLHLAIKENFDSKTRKVLVENASDEALAIQDDVGKTPMHYAAEYKRCTDDGAELIKLFIERDLKAMNSSKSPSKTFLDLLDNSGASVYLLHRTERLTEKRQSHERNSQNLPRISKSVDKPVVGELRPQVTAGPSKSVASSKPVSSQGNRLNRDNAKDVVGDEREKKYHKKKTEEAESYKNSEPPTKSDHMKERVVISHDANQIRSIKPSEPDESKAQLRASPVANTIAQLETMPNTPSNWVASAGLAAELGQEEERPAAKTKRDSPRTKNSNNILQRLKLHYMRTRSTEMVISFLYGNNLQDIQVSFDYDKLPRQIQWSNFLSRFGADSNSDRLRFDSVLQYVTFPKVQVQIKGRHADLEREAEEQSGVRQVGVSGCKDMKYFFDWLNKKGVRHIITLSVEDSRDSEEKVHSDQVIQESLEKFTIEHLDWRKTDLDPETILHVGSKATILHVGSKATMAQNSTMCNERSIQSIPQQLRQLSLKWSGSNSVLRAWSEPEGLPLLPWLQKIHLYKLSSNLQYDSPHWIQANVEKFKIRLNANRKAIRDREVTVCADQNSFSDDGVAFGDVEVDIIDSDKEAEFATRSRDTPHFSLTIPKGINSHKWLDSTIRFAAEMELFWRKTTLEFKSSKHNLDPTKKIASDVIVALIDDGVDMFDAGLSDRVLEGKSFDFHDGKVRPSFSSADGHGTVMASMILRACPMAKVYPIRLKTYPNSNGKSNIDADYAAQAILSALNKKADIISMSWTLPMSGDKSGSRNRLHDALKKAVDGKALMFCSAPDEGKFTKRDYPSGPWREDFFRIGAARADGTVFEWTPEDGITYVLPGVDVIRDQASSNSFGWGSAARFTKRIEDFKYETGSSVATALAAGLAAMIIYCIKSSIMSMKIRNQNKYPIMGAAIGDNDASLIAAPDAMKRAFARLGNVTPNRFIQVWEKFDEISEILKTLRREESSPEEKVKCIERFVEFGSELANSIRTS
ncbi:uncharacterized protein TrAtP1_009763 [Trichoderma atroviride]|uniref:uncharacterized protein n=1 Tax=Hypocrea atroviridis TaxID=63577 RepID=UPI00331CDCB1|nr:hypothetical protein TrAtP1_009763 [Trichoderma atroviride]